MQLSVDKLVLVQGFSILPLLILGTELFFVGEKEGLYTVGCLAAALASTCEMPGSTLTSVVTDKKKRLQTLPEVPQGQNRPT